MKCLARIDCLTMSVHRTYSRELECRHSDTPLDEMYLELKITGITEANRKNLKVILAC